MIVIYRAADPIRPMDRQEIPDPDPSLEQYGQRSKLLTTNNAAQLGLLYYIIGHLKLRLQKRVFRLKPDPTFRTKSVRIRAPSVSVSSILRLCTCTSTRALSNHKALLQAWLPLYYSYLYQTVAQNWLRTHEEKQANFENIIRLNATVDVKRMP